MRLEIAKKAALESGKILLNFKKELNVKFKGRKDIVTQADIKSQDKIIKTIKENFPEDGIFTEEGDLKQDTKNLWVIDPLDGTINFSRGSPLYGVSIAYSEDKVVKQGVIYLPVFDELYYAELGKGAFCNGKRLEVKKEDSPDKVLINFGDFNHGEKNVEERNENLYNLLLSMLKISLRVRYLGSMAVELVHLAGGKIDAFVAATTNYYDYAAGALIVKEAGGIVTDIKGEPVTDRSGSLLASNGIIHEKLLKITKSF
jgi:myo-inositol-1(or 4)-monophosphatase